jgi:O-antigen/teichoic acid export membrane protein
MNLYIKISEILRNKIFIFVIIRYFLFFIQFIGTILIASKLGPFFMGIWGFLLLIQQYYSFVSVGQGYSMNIILVQNKNNAVLEKEIVSSSFLIEIFQVSLIALFTLIIAFSPVDYFEKYSFSSYMWLACVIAIIAHFNSLFLIIYRIKNDIKKILFYQGVVPVLSLSAELIFKGEMLIYSLLVVFLAGNILALIYFMKGYDRISMSDITRDMILIIVRKGFFLLIYNLCFYFIVISTRTIISSHYSVAEFGSFTVVFTLASSVFLILEGVTFLLFPKLIDVFSKKNEEEPQKKLDQLRTIYITLTHGLVYLAICFFPLIFIFLPQYKDSSSMLNLITLSLLMIHNANGYSDLMMARNREKKISLLSTIALVLNILLAFILTKVFNVPIEYAILSVLVSYLIYTLLVVYYGLRISNGKFSIGSYLSGYFPLRLFLPYLCSLICNLLFNEILISVLIFIVYILLNIKQLKEIKIMFSRLIKTPDILNI